MIENRPFLNVLTHFILIVGVVTVVFPVYLAFIAATHGPTDFMSGLTPLLPGDQLVANFDQLLSAGNSVAGAPPFALMLPVEVRILPTYKVVADLGMLNSYPGLVIPLIASATATFLFRQFFLTIPEELMEAARVDGAGAMKFFRDILLPLSRTNIAALFIILFIYGWNQYLWPMLITTDPGYYTAVMGIKRLASVLDGDTQWNLVMAGVILAALPPVLIIIVMQRLFVKGLVETEK